MPSKSTFTASKTEEYFNALRFANTERAKKERFIQFLTSIYEGDETAQRTISQMNLGAERFITNIPRENKLSYGQADTQTETVIIEWEADLRKTGEHAKQQLAEYLTGNWRSGQRYQYTLIATDGVRWVIYAPDWSHLKRTQAFNIAASFTLRQIRSFELTAATLIDFDTFLDGLLFVDEQKRASLRQIQVDFGDTSSVFINAMRILNAVADEIDRHSELQVAFDQWRRFLSIAYGKFDNSPQMFMVHTYLSAFAKLLAFAVLVRRPVASFEEARTVISGEAFLELNVERFVEDDFFHWIASDQLFKIVGPVIHEINRRLAEYEFGSVDEDILKGVYQELIDLETRHALGEYYTPDWLCDEVVQSLNFQAQSKVLDPACGSGSFLRASVGQLRLLNPKISAGELSSQVFGIDIHPLSVQIAKTTLIVAMADLIRRASYPVAINVFLANSLLVPEETAELFQSVYKLNVDNNDYKLDLTGIKGPEDFDSVIDLCEQLALKHLKPMSHQKFVELLSKHKDPRFKKWAPDLHLLYLGLKTAKDEGRDSIWKFIIQNSYKPVFLRNTFDFVVGNPPWLTYSDISNADYQRNIRALAETYSVLPGRRANFPHLEIAAIFLSHAASYFLKDGGRVGFVMPRSFLTGDQHDNTRLGQTKSVFLISIWDLQNVAPLFRVPACVLIARRDNRKPGTEANYSAGISGRVYEGRLPAPEVSQKVAKDCLTTETKEWHVLRLQKGKNNVKTAFSTRALEIGVGLNAYYDQFTQGATIVPRICFFVDFIGEVPRVIENDRVFSIKSSETATRDGKDDWRGLSIEGRTEGAYFYKTAISRNVIPFALFEPLDIVLPIQIETRAKQRSIVLLSSDQMIVAKHRFAGDWFQKAEAVWLAHRTERNAEAKVSLNDYLNWQNKLTDQDIDTRYVVLYTASSKDASACIVDRKAIGREFIVESKTYWFATKSKAEALYVAAYLNSGFVNSIIKEFQTYGLFGARDIHKTVLGIPFPKFSQSDSLHMKIVEWSTVCEQKIARMLVGISEKGMEPRRLGTVREACRKIIEIELKEIDSVLANICGMKNYQVAKKRNRPRRKTNNLDMFEAD
jgi:methylase of polypeptide subunit release factors